MKPGIYDFSNEDYQKSPGISRSGIMELKKSPMHYWYNYLNKDRPSEPPTEAQLIGSALHEYFLEPEKFEQHFYVMKKINRRTKEGSILFNNFINEAGHRFVLSESVFYQIKAMADVLKNNPVVDKLISNCNYEKSIYWNDKETKVLCKCRPDIYDERLICDLKTTTDASPEAFKMAIYKYGYHIQAAMIQEAFKTLFNKTYEDFVFIVVEKNPPYAQGVYFLAKDAIERGREDFKEAILQYKKCLEKNEWPSFEVSQVSLPAYAFINY